MSPYRFPVILLKKLLHRLLPIIKRTHPGLFLKNPAEICLVVIPYYFPNLPDGQLRFVQKILLCLRNTQRGYVLRGSHIIFLAEDFRQITGTVVHIAGNDV